MSGPSGAGGGGAGSAAPYNPLDKRHLGASVAEALLARQLEALGGLAPFSGAGVYAIYYMADAGSAAASFPAYRRLAERNRVAARPWPLYVGKAVPAGARKGEVGLDAAPGPVLHKRLMEHAASLRMAENLELAHFSCRQLVVKDIWIPLGSPC